MRAMVELEKRLAEAEQQLKQNFSAQKLRELTKLKYEYNQKVEFRLFRVLNLGIRQGSY